MKQQNKIKIEINTPRKLPGLKSLFISFDFWDTKLIDPIRDLSNRIYNKDDKTWEIPFDKLNMLIDLYKNNEIIISFSNDISKNSKIPETYKFKTKPFQHQLDGIEYGLNHSSYILADEMGCVSGDAEILVHYNRINCRSNCKITLSKLYKLFKENPNRNFTVRCLMDDNHLGQNKVIDVLYSGIKETYLLELESTKSIRVTSDHEILTPNGYVALQNLKVGNYVLTEDNSKQDRVKSITYYGKEPTYDIKMQSPYHNFVANKIIVHNCGKAQTLDSIVYTDTGKLQFKDITVGTSIFSNDGKLHKVTGVYDRGIKDIYKLTFSDNTHVECCDEHLWEVSTSSKYYHKYKKIMPTGQLLSKYKERRQRIPITNPINFTTKNVPLDPYVLGCLLGDGGLSTHIVGFTSADKSIIDEINNRLPKNYALKQSKSMNKYCYTIIHKDRKITKNKGIYYADGMFVGNIEAVYNYLQSNNKLKNKNTKLSSVYFKLYPALIKKNPYMYGHNWTYKAPYTLKTNKVRLAIESMGLNGTTSHTKFIPEIYKYNDIKNRIQLLQGLIDTDGYIDKHGRIQYTSVSTKLLSDVQELVQSLGGTASKNYITLTIKLPDGIQPCKLERKLSRYNSNVNRLNPLRLVNKIEYIGKKECRCISVDSDNSLYLTDNFIVTHNTKQVIDLGIIRKLNKEIKQCLIICGVNTLKYNWENEIQVHSGQSYYILGTKKRKNGSTYIGSVNDRVKDIQTRKEFFLITNIETLRSDKFIKELNKRRDEIQMLILDEAHKAGNTESQQGKNLQKLSDFPYKIAMTGTPIVNNPIDSFAMLKWTGIEKSTFGTFKKYYCELGGLGNRDILGFKNLPQLRQSIAHCTLRRLKDDVLDLPPKLQQIEYIEMSAEQNMIYEEAREWTLQHIDLIMGYPNPLNELLRMRQATGYTGILSSTIKKSCKFDRLEEIVEELVNSNRKCVIFSNWRKITDPVTALMAKYNPAIVTGEVDNKKRMEEVKRFQENDKCKVFIGTIGACGVGINLTAAQTAIFLDEPWNNAAKIQAEDRIYRIGTKGTVNIITMMCRGTIDERIHQLILRKKEFADILVDGKQPKVDKNILFDLIG